VNRRFEYLSHRPMPIKTSLPVNAQLVNAVRTEMRIASGAR
jgi:hypothetical protein